ncbi:MAG: GTPase Era [Gammaproteobacteria bacterium]|jgi:GTP-binding protein Era
MNEATRCGFIALVGRPNVGKSTLLNHLIGQKISITSRKPQTTRHSLLGIKTSGSVQAIYVDTPGIHRAERRALGRYLNREALGVLGGVDVVVCMLDRLTVTEDDDAVIRRALEGSCSIICVINKIDRLSDKELLLPFIAELAERYGFDDIVPVSALRGTNLDRLEQRLYEALPTGLHLFPEDQLTDRSERFLAAEIIREKLVRRLGHELPYQSTVVIDAFEDRPGLVCIQATIYVERSSQKGIVIGKRGTRLKSIGQDARRDIEMLLERKVMLELWVKVKSGWSDDDALLESLGYTQS